MSRLNPHVLQMEISRMFAQGQSFFCIPKVQDWLRDRQQNPDEYDIIFHEKPAPPGSDLVKIVEIELRRKDGKAIESWLQKQVNEQS
ncbi:MAG: hypothetical protein SAJ12_17770 [Jaaginema sp. PMC 1079.18]|nr:hypothetical protein [Jaaginema sp. PMC 1080.18]MEC4852831.1 hypothetical protein [Jaaginema sp. PMC 1079.18]MEC4868065.1 hypothetical protein [Jaaginema sp. PMC 1078.18]